MIAEYISLPDDGADTVQAVQKILQENGLDIHDISARMRDYDGDGYLEGIAENVRGILKECLAHYIFEKHPEQKTVFDKILSAHCF